MTASFSSRRHPTMQHGATDPTESGMGRESLVELHHAPPGTDAPSGTNAEGSAASAVFFVVSIAAQTANNLPPLGDLLCGALPDAI